MHWCATSYAENSDEPEIQYGGFDVRRTAAQLADQLSMESMSEFFDADDEITWRMHVPKSYDPNKPAGLLVYISPTPDGRMPRSWQPVFDEENLIGIGADQSGNNTIIKKRMLLAALAPYVAAEGYEIDRDRVYLSGFSGGGKVASMASILYANLFRGAIYICGAAFWSKFSPPLLSQSMSHRYVFVTGGRDFNHALTKDIYKEYERAGMANINLMIIPGMGHSMPDTEYFREAIQYLDRRE